MKQTRYALNFADKVMPSSSSGFSPPVVIGSIKSMMDAACSVLNFVQEHNKTHEMAVRNKITEYASGEKLNEYEKQRGIQHEALVRQLDARLKAERRKLQLAAEEYRILTEEHISELEQNIDENLKVQQTILNVIKKERDFILNELKPAMAKFPLSIRKTTIYQQYSDMETLSLGKINDLLSSLIN